MRVNIRAKNAPPSPNETLLDIGKALEDLFASGSLALMYAVGKNCGIRSYRRLEPSLFPGSTGTAALKLLAERKGSEGLWEGATFTFAPDGSGEVYIEDCFEAKNRAPSDSPACYFVKGLLEGFLSEALHSPVRVTETSCLACGDERCTFSVSVSLD